MAVLRVGALPEQALVAAARFYAEVLPLLPPPLGEVDRAQREPVGANSAASKDNSASPLRPFGAPPPRGVDLVLVFPPADYTHRTWRLAAVQSLARDHAPIRINALVSDSEPAIAAALSYLTAAEGVTGQLLELDDTGAG